MPYNRGGAVIKKVKLEFDLIRYFCSLLFLAILCGCQAHGETRLNAANDIARQSSLSERHILAKTFVLTTFERVEKKDAVANIYIEGDGLAWVGKKTPSRDPTPTNPVALYLAAADTSQNVVYIARPCQYTKAAENAPCHQKYWTSARFSPEVISAMDWALDDIKARHHINGFHIIGYSGGAAIGVLLAERRKDILSLRTVVGNLDTDAFSQIHEISQLSESLNPAKAASNISHLPQHHFIGSDDPVVAPDIVRSFIKASGNTRCLHVSTIPDTTHETGWAQKWLGLLSYPVTCKD